MFTSSLWTIAPTKFLTGFCHVFSGFIFANGKANDNILTETQGEKGFLISIYVNLVLVIAVTDALQLKDYFWKISTNGLKISPYKQ